MTTPPRPRIIVITGAESTGKSHLTRELAAHFSAPWFPEYAREYLEKHPHPYTREEVIHIARKQVAQMEQALASGEEWYFFDTWLIITRVWMEVVYGAAPPFITEAIAASRVDLFLLCDTDLPWEPDPLRENGGEMRNQLSEIYRSLLERAGFRYALVTGTGKTRITNALRIIGNTFGLSSGSSLQFQ